MLEVRLVVTAGKQKVALESETAKKQPHCQLKKKGQKKKQKIEISDTGERVRPAQVRMKRQIVEAAG